MSFRIWMVIAGAALVLALMVSLASGSSSVGLAQLWAWIWQNSDARSTLIIEHLRLPRALLAAIVGALLATGGAVLQGLFRNPLADPSLIGVSAGASAGAALMMVMLSASAPSWLGLSLVSTGAFVGAAATVFVVYRIATSTTGTSVVTMLLAGMAVSFLAGSFTNLLEFSADSNVLRRISLWRMGGLDGADFARLWAALAMAVPVALIVPRYFNALDALLLGESEARFLGVNTQRVKIMAIGLTAFGVGGSVALAGTVAFVGLIVPHAVRFLIGPTHRRLIPLSALFGATLLVLADSLARVLLAPAELPLGVVTAVLGAPLFIMLLRRQMRSGLTWGDSR